VGHKARTTLRRPSNLLIIILSGCLAALVGVRASAREADQAAQPPPQTSAPAQQKPAAPAAPAPGYVGEDTCITCHDGKKESIGRTRHGRSMDARTPAATQGCESCHGPGAAHAADPVANKVITFKPKDAERGEAQCTTCHNRGSHTLWAGSQHDMRGLTCTSCHSAHSPKSAEMQLKGRNQMELCATCHRDKVAKLDRTGHMPVREGKMDCSSCHNTHGSTNVRLLRKGDSISELCTSCHAEKRGPFLWEHPPSRDGCNTCHDPHGSSNDRMLVTRPPMLCQRCHVATQHPSTIYDAGLIGTSARVYARSCVTCHSAIHGSNHPSGQRFIR
jgi:DmsE family decaheme c-type cytochrome